MSIKFLFSLSILILLHWISASVVAKECLLSTPLHSFLGNGSFLFVCFSGLFSGGWGGRLGFHCIVSRYAWVLSSLSDQMWSFFSAWGFMSLLSSYQASACVTPHVASPPLFVLSSWNFVCCTVHSVLQVLQFFLQVPTSLLLCGAFWWTFHPQRVYNLSVHVFIFKKSTFYLLLLFSH